MRGKRENSTKQIFLTVLFFSFIGIFSQCSLGAHTGIPDIFPSLFINPKKLVFESCYTESKESFQAGNGSAKYPYAICNFAQLKNVYKDLGASYILGQDINANRTENKSYNQGRGWEPITPFSGNFDGKGFSIYGLHIRHSNPGNSVFSAFFGKLSKGARVQNLGIKDIDILIESPMDPRARSIFAGCLAGLSQEAEIHNSYAKGKIIIKNSGNNLRAELGGLVGYQSRGRIKQSYADCDISLKSSSSLGLVNAGALIGFNAGSGSIEDSYAMGKILILSKNIVNAGALVGTNISGTKSFKGVNYYLKSQIKKAVASGSCSPKNCIEQSFENLKELDETKHPLNWDERLWLARKEAGPCLKNPGPYGQSCP